MIIVCFVLALIGWIAFRIIDKGSDDAPSVETAVSEDVYSFDSIRVTGHTDVEIVAGTVHTNMVSDVDLVGTEPEDGKVAVIGEEGRTGPSVKTDGSTLVIDGGDTDISGDLKGLTEISSESGDIMVIVSGNLDKYGMDITSGKDGDIWVDARKIDDVRYTKDVEDEWDDGNRMLKLSSSSGEIVVKYK